MPRQTNRDGGGLQIIWGASELPKGYFFKGFILTDCEIDKVNR